MKTNDGKTIRWSSLSPAVFIFAAFAAGCADFQMGGAPFGDYGGRRQVVYVQPQPVIVSQASPTWRPVGTARTETGATFNEGMARLRAWNAAQREREIGAYLARHPEFRNATQSAITDLKAKLNAWDMALDGRRELVTRVGGDLSADVRYAQLRQGRAQTQARLDQIEASLVTAMLEENAGAIARNMSWTAEKARALDLVARNAAAAEMAEGARADDAFRSAIY